ncbi:MAG: hypothetical protein L6R36_005208 [Xanthoria steineri]|nr:MAG: hypothetical protein L6R36_005208 [Xanthoria steineri]
MYIPTLITPLLLLLLSPLASAIDILLPLYLYPDDSATAWSPIFQTISTHPTTTFQIVINPNSGPGTPSLLTDANLITGISKLNAYPNVRTLGYVLTGYGKRDNTAVTADVDVYAHWSAAPEGADIHLDGIYFDEVSNDATQSNYDRMASFSRHARESIGGATVVFNPGYRAPEPLFASCDLMVEFEHPLADYKAEGVLGQIPPAFAGKSAVQILETPTTAGTDVSGLVAAMEEQGLGAFFFGTDCCYKVWERGLLEAMADAAA